MLNFPRFEPFSRPQQTVFSSHSPPPPQLRNMNAPVEFIDLTGDDSPPPAQAPLSRPSSSTPSGFERQSPAVRSRAGSSRRTPAAAAASRRRTAVHINDIIDHDVIDVDSLPDRPAAARSNYNLFERNSARIQSPEPEIEITFARARLRPPPQQPGGYRGQRVAPGPSPAIYMENIQFPDPPRGHHHNSNRIFNFNQWDAITRAGGGLMQLFSRGFHRPEMQGAQYFNPPMGLDYDLRDGILGDPPREDPSPLAVMPNDKPLPPVREGFTRDPVPDDVIVCPECDQELGDSENETARAIWVGKCGHCYCGDCAQKILNPPVPVPTGSKRKRATKPTCSVVGCRQSFSTRKTFWELYI